MSFAASIRRDAEAISRSPDSVVEGLRANLSAIILRRLKQLKWSQRRLAEEAVTQDSKISELIHGDENWTAETAGKILFALGLRARIIEEELETATNEAARSTGDMIDVQEAKQANQTENTSLPTIGSSRLGRSFDKSADVGGQHASNFSRRRRGRNAVVQHGISGGASDGGSGTAVYLRRAS